MSTHKTTNPELKARLERALRENLRKRKSQQRERQDEKKPEVDFVEDDIDSQLPLGEIITLVKKI
jgi:hypothetical protein